MIILAAHWMSLQLRRLPQALTLYRVARAFFFPPPAWGPFLLAALPLASSAFSVLLVLCSVLSTFLASFVSYRAFFAFASFLDLSRFGLTAVEG